MSLDLSRSALTVQLGTHAVDPIATFQAGQPLELGANGLTLALGTNPVYGVAKWNKMTAPTAVVVGEQVILPGTTAVNLANAGVVAGSAYVTNASTGAVYTVTTDFTINTTNSQITRVSNGSIPDGAAVNINYTYTLSTYQKNVTVGTNYMNLTDDTQGSGKMTVIQNFAEFYTDMYDTSVAYTLGGQLYITSSTGKFTSATVTVTYGKCISVPTAADPYLGVQIGQGS